MLVLLWGCSGPDSSSVVDKDDAEESGATGDTADSGRLKLAGIDAWCETSMLNPLRATCVVEVDPPGPVEVAFAPVDGAQPERVHGSPVVASSHEVALYLMRADAEIRWTARRPGTEVGPTSTLFTGSLPINARVSLEVEGTPSMPLVGFTTPCVGSPQVLIADAATGDVLWMDRFIDGPGLLDGATFTDAGTVLGVVAGGFREVDLTGRVLLDVGRADLSAGLHHDLFRADGLTYALYQRVVVVDGSQYKLDGIFVIDGEGKVVGDWFLGDHHVPTDHSAGQGLPEDYSHANSVWVDAAGDILVSFRHLSTAIKIDGFAKKTFGNIAWVFAGEDDAKLGQDFVVENLTGGVDGFAQQHNLFQRADGRWALFDNRLNARQNSRLLIFDLDESTRKATLAEAYDLGVHCPFQGGALHSPSGNPVATCAPFRTALEFEAGAYGADGSPEQPVWRATADCLSGSVRYVARFAPLDW